MGSWFTLPMIAEGNIYSNTRDVYMLVLDDTDISPCSGDSRDAEAALSDYQGGV